MADENEDESDEEGKVVNISNWKPQEQETAHEEEKRSPLEEALGTPKFVVPHEPSKFVIDFPLDWKELCREIIEIYRLEEAVDQKPLGFTKLRDRIMFGDDTREDGRLIRSKQLTRQDLQNWILYGKEPSNPKFWFIDKFIRYLQISNSEIVRKIHDYKENKRKKILSEIYQPQHRRHRDELAEFTRLATGRLLLSRTIPAEKPPLYKRELREGGVAEIRQFGIYIKPSDAPIFSILLAYPSEPISSENSALEWVNVEWKFGYLIPQVEDSPGIVAGIIIASNEDEFASKQSSSKDYQYSRFYLDFQKASIFIFRGNSVDDPLGWSTELLWDQTGKKFSPFASKRSDAYADYESELTDSKIEYNNLNYLENLKNRYMIW